MRCHASGRLLEEEEDIHAEHRLLLWICFIAFPLPVTAFPESMREGASVLAHERHARPRTGLGLRALAKHASVGNTGRVIRTEEANSLSCF